MSIYSYKALQGKSQEVHAVIEADSRVDAVAKIRAQGLFLLDIQEGRVKEKRLWQRVFKGLYGLLPSQWLAPKKSDVVQTYRQLSLMLTAGNALLESLSLAAELAKRRRLKQALLTIKSELQRGVSFAEALNQYPKLFPAQVVELIKSAEASGEMDNVLLRLADDVERQLEAKRSVITAMIYPVLVITMSIGLMVFMAIWVLPNLVGFIESRNVEVPIATQYLILISNFITYQGAYALGVIGAICFSVLAWYTTPSGKAFLDRMILSLPIIGNTIITSSMAQNGWTLSMLSANGVTLLDSLRICSRVTDNIPLKRHFEDASSAILNGDSLTKALQQRYIPELFYKMASVAEQSGELDRVMLEVGNYFNKQLQARIKTMMALIEPALMLGIGIPVAFVYLSIFQLIFKVSTGGR